MKNEPAFPQPDPIANEFHKKFGTDRGMTLRDYFAAHAISVSLQACVGFESAAEEAYMMADAMLKAREA